MESKEFLKYNGIGKGTNFTLNAVSDILDEYAQLLQSDLDKCNARIKELEAESQWIKVEDRLPEKGERVICYWNPKSVSSESPHITTEELIDKEGFRLACVTHWMPLPNKPIHP